MADSLEDRLRSHAKAFDGLLSLIPAKYYYGEDNSDQWQRKKQTKEEARNAKRAKLDPDSSKTVKDVMDENARKRKREEDADKDAGEGPVGSGDEDIGSEKPREGLNRREGAAKKKKKTEKTKAPQDKADDESGAGGDAEARKKQKLEKKASKREQKKAKAAAAKSEKKPEPQDTQKHGPKTPKTDTKAETETKEGDDEPEAEEDDDKLAEEMNPVEGFSLGLSDQAELTSFASTPISISPGLDTSNPHSGSSSISSIVPPIQPSELNKNSPGSNKTKPSPEELRQRLQKRLDELRAARHADGFNGKPARNRQELIEARRQREEQRRAHKKELRAKAKEEEQRLRDEAISRRFSPSNSGSLLASPRSPAESATSPTNNFSFGRVAFSDGQQADPSLTNIETHRKRGPQDAGTALKAAQNKKSRLAGLDEAKKADIEEKDMWLNAKKRAHGERVRDDTSLLKKTLKRKEGVKKKSEREWSERMEGIAKGQEMKQSKREANLRKRKDEKGSKGKKGGSSKGKSRPGFEGSFKSKTGGKKK